ncbi:hypothetical protein MLD38_028122 [Melastoma candidum]|uniref:Uncharacterized protein n=1 Tax=Melastoma candidum TaxID=119954 RepID=A0ACB9N044_9MYRT|nr:hypothetical protein MLD38_028122 [Melastoma candidum]
MSTSSPATAFAASLSALILTATSAAASPLSATTYEVLESYNFPEGILPKGVTGHDQDPSTGKFSLYLNSSCSLSLEGSYQLRYKPLVPGVVSRDRLTGLGGVCQEREKEAEVMEDEAVKEGEI